MAIIGQIVAANKIPAGYLVKAKGVRASVYLDIVNTVAGLKVGEAVDLPQDLLENAMGKALPASFKGSLKAKLKKAFAASVELVYCGGENGGKSLFHLVKTA